jgi:hypothetical protein
MSFSDALSIAGIAVSILFGLWGIYLAVRRAKYPASLTFVREQSVALFEDFAQKLPNLSVLYKDTPVAKSVVLIRGYLVNHGALDITREMTEEALTCSLPPESMWLEFKVTTSAPSLHVTSELLDARNARLEFGLFRRDESFSFQALVQLGERHADVKATDFADTLSWRHRIASLGEVKTVQMPAQPKRSKAAIWTKRGLTVVFFITYLVMGLSLLTQLGPLGRQPSLVFTTVLDGKSTTVRLSPIKDGMTTIKDVETGNSRDVDLKAYSKTTAFTPVWTDKRDSSWMNWSLGAFMVFASFAFLVNGFSTEYRRFKLKRLVSSSLNETEPFNREDVHGQAGSRRLSRTLWASASASKRT